MMMKGSGTRGNLTLGLVAIYSKVKGKLVLCVLGKFDRVPEPLEPRSESATGSPTVHQRFTNGSPTVHHYYLLP